MTDRLFWSIFSRARPRTQVSRKLPRPPHCGSESVHLLCPQPWLPLLGSGALEREPATDLHSFTCGASGGEKTRFSQTLCALLAGLVQSGRSPLGTW